MTAREPLMDQAFFEEKIKSIEQSTARFEETISKPDTKLIHRNRLLYTLFHNALRLVIAEYSAGRPIADLRPLFPDIVARRERNQEALGRLGTDFKAIDDYVQSIWLVSLGILLDIDPPLFDRLLKCIGNEGRDKLFERLVAVRVKGRPQATELIWPKPYQSLFDAIDGAAGDRPKLMSAFLKTWYPAYGKLKVYWYDGHKGPEGGGFVGYWCFEAAAVVKAFSFDDSEFREAPYYPRDMLQGI